MQNSHFSKEKADYLGDRWAVHLCWTVFIPQVEMRKWKQAGRQGSDVRLSSRKEGETERDSSHNSLGEKTC